MKKHKSINFDSEKSTPRIYIYIYIDGIISNKLHYTYKYA